MAKIDEGDERWIVEDRPDGRNVNNWHWSERDVSQWAKKKLTELFVGSVMIDPSSPDYAVKIVKLQTMDGDATLYIRKGQLKTVYDLKVTLNWEVVSKSINDTAENNEKADKKEKKNTKGSIAFELFDEDPEVTFKFENKGSHEPLARSILKAKSEKFVQEKAVIFIDALKKGADVPLDEIRKIASSGADSNGTNNRSAAQMSSDSLKKATINQAQNSATQLVFTEVFRAKPADLFLAFIDENRIKSFTMSNALVSNQVGGNFSINNGLVTGQHIELDSCKRIVQRWRMSTWQEGVYSRVELVFKENDDMTELYLTQSDVPADHRHEVENFWRVEFFHRMKLVLGYSATRFF